MNKTNEEVKAGVTRYWNRVASQNNMTVDEYHAYRKAQNEQKRKEWGLSMADAITEDDATSLLEYAEKLASDAWDVYDTALNYSGNKSRLGNTICALHDRVRLITAVLDRIDENRH